MIPVATRSAVLARAQHRCEYCQRHADDSPLVPLQIEHITPRKHGGADDFANLAAACVDCNLRKGSNLAGLDPETNQLTSLFDPRRQRWDDHFRWDGLGIVGKSDIGRTTIRVLDLNSTDQIEVRLWAIRPPMRQQ